jgi:hypothetical protein
VFTRTGRSGTRTTRVKSTFKRTVADLILCFVWPRQSRRPLHQKTIIIRAIIGDSFGRTHEYKRKSGQRTKRTVFVVPSNRPDKEQIGRNCDYDCGAFDEWFRVQMMCWERAEEGRATGKETTTIKRDQLISKFNVRTDDIDRVTFVSMLILVFAMSNQGRSRRDRVQDRVKVRD